MINKTNLEISKNTSSKYWLIAIIVSILTTGYLRLQLMIVGPETDGGINTFVNQFIFTNLNKGNDLNGPIPLHLYSYLTAWVYSLEINQYIFLRIIDGLIAMFASILFFQVILRESKSIIFTMVLIIPLLIIMNDAVNIGFGFKNSIWVSYVPFFTALLIWQKLTKEDRFSFYFIGALISLGVLFREPFLPFFILTGFVIYINYGWRILLKYLIGSASLGFSIIILVLLHRGGDLIGFVNSYVIFAGGLKDYAVSEWSSFLQWGLYTIKVNWMLCIISVFSAIYIIKSYFFDKKMIPINRFYFWLAISFIPLLEPIMKVGFPYHFANCLPGLAGLSAMAWKQMNTNESKIKNRLSIATISLMSFFIILPTLNHALKDDNILSPLEVFRWANSNDAFRQKIIVENNNYLIAAARIYELSREDSTLVVSGHMQAIYPLTGLLPPIYELNDLRTLYSGLNFNENKLLKIIEKYRPTLILTTNLIGKGEKDLPGIINKTNLYNKVGVIEENLEIDYGWKSGIIYRLKDFK